MQFKASVAPEVITDPFYIDVILRTFSRNVSRTMPAVVEEVQMLFDNLVPDQRDDGGEHSIVPIR